MPCRLFHTSEKTDNKIFHYILWFQTSDGRLLLDEEQNKVTAFLDGRYYNKDIEGREYMVEKVLRNKKFTELLDDYITWEEHIHIQKSLPYNVREQLSQWSTETYGSDIFVFDETYWATHIRVQKSASEIASIQQAIQINHTLRASIQDLWDHIIGMTELDVRGMLIQQAMSLGASDEAFDTIVASGAHTAIPHHRSSRTVIEPWPLLIDMWWVVDGYCSDMTRSMRIGDDIDPEYQQILDLTMQAHDVATEMSVSGVGFADIARAAREVIEQGGYGEYFTHSLWHGVGLDIHEAPSVSTRSTDTIQQGMVYTIEPGIYLPDRFGVRWENIVIVQ